MRCCFRRIICLAVSCVLINICITVKPISAVYRSSSPFKSTFIQGWLCRDWTAQRWEEEFAKMKEAGFESLIIQSVCDFTYEYSDTSKSSQDTSAYTLSSSYCLYPSSLDALSGAYVSSQNAGDALGLAFEAAKKYDMQIYLGLANDDRWWKYGWGAPQTADDGTAYFSLWCSSNASLCADIIAETYSLYADAYAQQLAGFYYVNEIWNIDVACNGTDNGIYAQIIGENINGCLNAINDNCPELPLLISPFFNETISSSHQYGDFWRDIFSVADFRAVDIFAHQDGSGNQRSTDVVREWALALKNAVEESTDMQFWINNETFQSDYSSKPVAQLADYVTATNDLTDCRIVFSWNHYYNPLVDSSYAVYNEEFKQLVLHLSYSVLGDINADGVFDINDIATLQRYINRSSHAEDWQAGDMNADEKLDVSDLCIMKRRMLKQ